MPELNIWLNLKRSFSAVWQTYQGLGLVGGMAHSNRFNSTTYTSPFHLNSSLQSHSLSLALYHDIFRYFWNLFWLNQNH